MRSEFNFEKVGQLYVLGLLGSSDNEQNVASELNSSVCEHFLVVFVLIIREEEDRCPLLSENLIDVFLTEFNHSW